jgi:hypothetical protein
MFIPAGTSKSPPVGWTDMSSISIRDGHANEPQNFILLLIYNLVYLCIGVFEAMLSSSSEIRDEKRRIRPTREEEGHYCFREIGVGVDFG